MKYFSRKQLTEKGRVPFLDCLCLENWDSSSETVVLLDSGTPANPDQPDQPWVQTQHVYNT